MGYWYVIIVDERGRIVIIVFVMLVYFVIEIKRFGVVVIFSRVILSVIFFVMRLNVFSII